MVPRLSVYMEREFVSGNAKKKKNGVSDLFAV